jgi:hypothetical protein
MILAIFCKRDTNFTNFHESVSQFVKIRKIRVPFVIVSALNDGKGKLKIEKSIIETVFLYFLQIIRIVLQ